MSEATAALPVTAPVAIALPKTFLQRLLRKPLAWVAIAWLALVLGLGLAANHVAQFDPLDQDLLAVKQLPSAEHWLGTDTLGRDVASRVLHGVTPTFIGVLQALLVVSALGVGMGLAAGYFGGRTDAFVGQLTNLFQALPMIVIALAVLTVFHRSMLAAMVTFGIIGSAGPARVIRSATLAIRNELYIEAARISGLSDISILFRHVLPRVVGPVIVQLSLIAAIAVIVQTGISFLGLGVPPPAPTWGGGIFEAAASLNDFPWLLVPSGGVVALTILAFGLLGDALRDTAVEAWSRPVHRKATRLVDNAGLAAGAFGQAPGNAVLSVRALSIVTGEGAQQRTLVDRVDFDLLAGETLGLVGESGSGKTLTSLALMGLLPPGTRIASGALRLAGQVIDLTDEERLRSLRGQDFAMIFQEPMAALDPCFTIGHQLAEVIRCHARLDGRQARERAIALLRQVKIQNAEEVAKRYPHQISGGMAQRVGIARALAPHPKVLFADEPTTALDVTVQADILELLRTLKEEHGMAVVFVTHDWGVVADICDRAMVLFRGRMLETADVIDIFDRPQHPYTQALLRANPHNAPPGQVLPTVDETLARMAQEAA
ncbi:dipeptide/oligopeptide/nickel ABC transporter permease/ATP-binding protein [Ramlibacter agri]|uniref:dipeptide/oligopeptide/nickel ABC transporter permease/ATP-binding protein n=1 Tax=Ramlibacter agri TaxID=2728837 RepID=UPI00197E64E4|nr:dipeptide/oligopeptide/nickel ABC transporter permease/ATP-binding protein [Ramlibacter agri]